MSPRQGDGDPENAPKRRRASRRRAEIPSPPEVVDAARKVARRRAKLQAQLEVVRVEQLRAVVELRATGASLTEIAELLGVTQGRVYQMVREADAEGITPQG